MSVVDRSTVVGAMVGGGAATFGGRWATSRDLMQRNRHALHLDELPKALRTHRALTSESDLEAREFRDFGLWFDALHRVIDRTLLLSRAERRLGKLLAQRLQKIETRVDSEQRRSAASANLADDPWTSELSEVAKALEQLRSLVKQRLRLL